jgi:ribosome maturation factor RimP
MIDLIGKVVEVGTPETKYFGKLVEVNEEEVYLETDSGWVVVPIEKIAYIREPED